jgi:hypothetical protein
VHWNIIIINYNFVSYCYPSKSNKAQPHCHTWLVCIRREVCIRFSLVLFQKIDMHVAVTF